MKKFICLLLATVTLTAALAACGKSNNSDKQSDYPHSKICLISGENSAYPLQAELWSEERFEQNGDAVVSDFLGAEIFFDDKNCDIPCLILNGEITLDMPIGVKIGAPKIYDKKFQVLDTAPAWDELYQLGKGEYFITFTETWDVEDADKLRESGKPFGRYGYENLFKLIITE